MMVFLCLVIIAVAIPGIIYSADVSNGLKSTRCSLFSSVGDLTLNKDGNKTKWIGMEELSNKLSNISDHVTEFASTTEETFKDDASKY
jgi:hypothetical protein